MSTDPDDTDLGDFIEPADGQPLPIMVNLNGYGAAVTPAGNPAPPAPPG